MITVKMIDWKGTEWNSGGLLHQRWEHNKGVVRSNEDLMEGNLVASHT